MKIPDFYIPGILDWPERLQNIEHAMTLGLDGFTRRPEVSGYLTIACYGPSLTDTYRDLCKPILSVSGAHDFLIGKGVIPQYHVEADPRAHKAEMLTLANDQTEYLIASCCHPAVFEALKGRNVKIWHCNNGPESEEWAAVNGGMVPCVGGGSTVGLRAMQIGHLLGFRAIELHGMDSSFANGKQWAGAHSGKRKEVVTVEVKGRKFLTSPLMIQAAREAVQFWRTTDVKLKVCGSGLFKTMFEHTRGS